MGLEMKDDRANVEQVLSVLKEASSRRRSCQRIPDPPTEHACSPSELSILFGRLKDVLEAARRSPEVNLDAGSLAEVLEFVAGDLDQPAEEELRHPEVGEGAKIDLGHSTGQRTRARSAAGGGLDEAGDGEGYSTRRVQQAPARITTR